LDLLREAVDVPVIDPAAAAVTMAAAAARIRTPLKLAATS
jgi:Asp/Glu/hydantoin racemase